jgi:hypothetical protein
MKALPLVALALCLSASSSFAATRFQLYPRPAGLEDAYAQRIMADQLGIREPMVAVYPVNGVNRPLQDITLDDGSSVPGKNTDTGYWEVPGAKDTAVEIAILSQATGVSAKPGLAPFESWPANSPVRVLRKAPGFVLVTDGQGRTGDRYAWVPETAITPVAANALALPSGDFATGLPGTALAWQTLARQIDEYRALAVKKECPADMSVAEKDGIIQYSANLIYAEQASLENLSDARATAIDACMDGKRPPAIHLKSAPKMKAATCACFFLADMFENTETRKTSAKSWSQFATRKASCERRGSHYQCDQDDGESEASLACPASCF